MTTEEKEERIGRAHGWIEEKSPFQRHGITIRNGSGKVWWHPDISGCSFRPPSYFSDLNAIHEAEKRLQHYGAFVDTLAKVMGGPRGSIMLPQATAAQRAEALGQTLKLW